MNFRYKCTFQGNKQVEKEKEGVWDRNRNWNSFEKRRYDGEEQMKPRDRIWNQQRSNNHFFDRRRQYNDYHRDDDEEKEPEWMRGKCQLANERGALKSVVFGNCT